MRFRLLGLPAVMILIAHGCAEQSDGAIAEPDVGGRGGKAGMSGSGGKAGSTSTGKGGTTSGGSSGSTSNGGTSGSDGGSAQGGDPTGGGGDPTGGGGDTTGGGGDPTGGGGEGGGGPIIGAGGGCSLPDAPIAGISARYESEHDNASEYYIGSVIKIHNAGPNTINLDDLTVRYYLTNEVAEEVLQQTENWAWLRDEGADLKGALSFELIDAMDCAVAGATHFIDFNFDGSAGNLLPNHYVEFSWQLGNAASQLFDQTNDYSFSSSQTQADDYSKVVILNASGVVWGDPP